MGRGLQVGGAASAYLQKPLRKADCRMLPALPFEAFAQRDLYSFCDGLSCFRRQVAGQIVRFRILDTQWHGISLPKIDRILSYLPIAIHFKFFYV